MIPNNIFNLMNQLTQESKSLWRIKNTYMKDAKSSKITTAFWKKMSEDKKKHVDELQDLIRTELGSKK